MIFGKFNLDEGLFEWKTIKGDVKGTRNIKDLFLLRKFLYVRLHVYLRVLLV